MQDPIPYSLKDTLPKLLPRCTTSIRKHLVPNIYNSKAFRIITKGLYICLIRIQSLVRVSILEDSFQILARSFVRPTSTRYEPLRWQPSYHIQNSLSPHLGEPRYYTTPPNSGCAQQVLVNWCYSLRIGCGIVPWPKPQNQTRWVCCHHGSPYSLMPA